MSVENVQRRKINNCDVFIGKGLDKEFLPRLNAVIEEGTIAVVYQYDSIAVASVIMHELKRNGYRVFTKCIEESVEAGGKNVPEYVRHVFCVGEEVSLVKQISSELNVEWSLFVTAPTSDDIMHDNPPKQVFIDENVLLNCRNEQIAAGYGVLLSSRIEAFENWFSKFVLGINAHPYPLPEAKEMPVCELVWEILNLSYNKTSKSSAERIAQIMRALAIHKGKPPRLEGEYRFLASCVLGAFYSAYLGAPAIDCALPPCVCDDLDKLHSLSINIENNVKCIDFFDISSYFRISYVLSEYRLDLLEKLASSDMRGTERFWRRLYPDAGYWLKSEITASEVLECLYLAGVMSDGFLGFAYAGGIMNNFG